MRIIAALLAITLALPACVSETKAPLQPDQGLLEAAETLRAEGEIPALTLAEFTCKSRKVAWSGLRRAGFQDAIDPNTRFAIGSNAKSMLATAAVRLGVDLDRPLSDLWPEMVESRPDKSGITLRQLLSHSSGLPAFDTGSELESVPDFEDDARLAALGAAEWFLDQPLIENPGTRTVYSNAGYVVAGAILEHVYGTSFDVLIEQEVFNPLSLQAGFGEPRHFDPPTYGHYVEGGSVKAYSDPEPPIPPFLEAAGNIHLPVNSYVTYLQAHLCGLQGLETGFLSGDAFKEMHTPTLEGGSGLGWGISELGGATTSFHIGGTGDFTAFAALAPERDRGVAALMNVGGAPASPVQAWVVEMMSETP